MTSNPVTDLLVSSLRNLGLAIPEVSDRSRSYPGHGALRVSNQYNFSRMDSGLDFRSGDATSFTGYAGIAMLLGASSCRASSLQFLVPLS